jgi:membrane-associated protease RseP (regulator of RpoE activity)
MSYQQLMRRLFRLVPISFLVLTVGIATSGQAKNRFHTATLSITALELQDHLSVLADDVYEGRLAGSRGGRAAANYLAVTLSEYGLVPAGEDDTYFQTFQRGYRNILALLPGSDPELAHEVVVLGAHYDHVGYGSSKTSYGPTGQIHNGADDNASGVSALLEVMEALQLAQISPRRSILLAFWDGEELGMVGSKHWLAHPTVARERVRLLLNADMIGWLRKGRLVINGSRTGYGFRRFLSGELDESLRLDFNWNLEANSDHWPFFQRQVPVVTFHTGLHDHYHRPTDDVARINQEGLEQVSRYIYKMVVKAANSPQLPEFRKTARRESSRVQRRSEAPAPPLRPRIGIHWQPVAPRSDLQPLVVVVTRVAPRSPASHAGFSPGDQIKTLDGAEITNLQSFHRTLGKAEQPLIFGVTPVAGPADSELREVVVVPVGPPVRLGISWREDEAEPGSVFLTRVVDGSPAAVAGMAVYDRIYEVDGQPFSNRKQFGEMVRLRLDDNLPQIEFLVETSGWVHPLTVRLDSDQP